MIASPILADPDPIFAAIECWKKAVTLENAVGHLEEMAEPASDVRIKEIANEASDIRIKATYAVFEMVPTTLAGMRAKIDFTMSEQYVTECLTSAGTDKPLREFLDTFYEATRQMATRL
jgi:hypothetical protein